MHVQLEPNFAQRKLFLGSPNVILRCIQQNKNV